MKKKLAQLLVFCIAMLLLSGCGDKNVVSAKLPEQTQTLPEAPREQQPDTPEAPAAENREPEKKEDAVHQHDYRTSTVAATCTAPGYTLHRCDCGDSYTTEETAALGHDYQSSVVAATAESGGYTLHKCSRCGDSYQDNYTEKLSSAPGDGVDHWTLEGGISAYDPIVKEYARNYDPQQATDAGNAYIRSLGLVCDPTIDTSTADHTGISFGGDEIWLKGGQAWFNEQAKAEVEYTKNYLDKEFSGGSDIYRFYCTAWCSDYTTMYEYGVSVWYTFK